MKRLNNIFMSVLFVLGSAGIGTAAAHGNVWTPGEVDPNTPSQSIQGEEQAVVPAEGDI
jgi:hypothetical protein